MKSSLITLAVLIVATASCTASTKPNGTLTPTPGDGAQPISAKQERSLPGNSDEDGMLPRPDLLMLTHRTTLLSIAEFCWALNHDGTTGSVDLLQVSQAGFFPFWIRDPLSDDPISDDPIDILREKNPKKTQVAYWPGEGESWSFSLISSRKVQDPDAEALKVSGEAVPCWLSLAQNAGTNPETAGTIPESHWDILRWALSEGFNLMLDIYLVDHGAMPESLEDLLDQRFIINQDFLTRAAELIDAGNARHLECGIIPGHDIFYFEYETADGKILPTGWRHRFGPDGYDTTDLSRRIPIILPDGLERTVFLSTDILGAPEGWLPEEDIYALSEFHTP